MNGTGQVLEAAVIPIFVIAIFGILMRRWNWLTEEADQSLLKVTVNLLTPALILDSVLKNDALRDYNNIVLPPLIGFATVVFGIGCAFALKRFMRFDRQLVFPTFAVCVGFYNYGYVPVPLVNAVFHDGNTLGVLFVHNVGVDIALWTVGLYVLNAGQVKLGWKRLLNPPLLVIFAALIVNFFGWNKYIPQWFLTAAKMLGQCSIPMGLILIGATIADHMHELPASTGWPTIIWGCVIRLALVPVFFVIAAKFLPISLELKRIMVIQAAMPSAVFPIVMAKHYGGDSPTALRVVLGTSIVGLLTIPLWIKLGILWVGL